MAIGDAAAAAGLTTYASTQDRRLGYENDNRNADYIAADRARLTKLEAQTIGVPKFSVSKSSNGQSLGGSAPTILTSSAFGTPVINRGGWGWSGGALTVPKTGVYTVMASLKLEAEDYYNGYVGVTRNVSDPSNLTPGAFIARSVVYPGERASNTSNKVAPSMTATRLLVALNAGDVLRVAAFQSNYGQDTVGIDEGATSLTFEVLWSDTL